ncbi:MAG TPA: XrtA system polysaccharide deacetylase [Gemmatimonadaceae bacterium]|nr:XrtA system polysaccharide deacetylase [Gemmatimonadaceae bacterium]
MPLSNRDVTHFFTVDVEEYFQVKALESVVSRDEWLMHPSRVTRSVNKLLETLARYNVRGTFFVLGWLAKHRPLVVRTIAEAGHEIASHGFAHERVTSLNRRSFREDIRVSKRLLEDVAGMEVLGYRAPSFSIVPGCEWAFDALIEEGYRYDSSLFPIRRRGYGYPASPSRVHVLRRSAGELAEFPLATTQVLGLSVPAAGGGYLRLLPPALTHRAFAEATARKEPATFYIHPWEIDHLQPRLPVSQLNHIRHYTGLKRTLYRIEKLLREFRFGAIDSYLPHVPRVTRAGAA